MLHLKDRYLIIHSTTVVLLQSILRGILRNIASKEMSLNFSVRMAAVKSTDLLVHYRGTLNTNVERIPLLNAYFVILNLNIIFYW